VRPRNREGRQPGRCCAGPARDRRAGDGGVAMRTIREMRRARVVLGRPGLAGTGINEAEKAQLIQNTSVLAALRFDPGHPTYGAIRGTVSPSQRTANRMAIQQAADDAAASGGTLVIKGEYEIDGTVSVRCHVDASDGVLSVVDAAISPALLVGSLTSAERLANRRLMLPSVLQRGKTGTGWTGTAVGIVASNLYTCQVNIPHVMNFPVGVRFTANGAGNVYNEISLGFLENNKVGLEITTEDASGWTNENVWYNGRFHINSNEGANITGARHIAIRTNGYQNNNHLFIKPSIEGNGPQYHIASEGAYITIIQGRYEASPPRVRLGPNSSGHTFDQGWGLANVVFTIEGNGGAHATSRKRAGDRVHAGGGAAGVMALTNHSSSTNPALTVMEASVPLSAD